MRVRNNHLYLNYSKSNCDQNESAYTKQSPDQNYTPFNFGRITSKKDEILYRLVYSSAKHQGIIQSKKPANGQKISEDGSADHYKIGSGRGNHQFSRFSKNQKSKKIQQKFPETAPFLADQNKLNQLISQIFYRFNEDLDSGYKSIPKWERSVNQIIYEFDFEPNSFESFKHFDNIKDFIKTLRNVTATSKLLNFEMFLDLLRISRQFSDFNVFKSSN